MTRPVPDAGAIANPATARRDPPVLLTPGPLTTAPATRQAMLRDWGSRDADFIALTRRLRARLVDLVAGADSHVCVPIQGSGTFAVEAMIGTMVPRAGRMLVLVNGAYGHRIARIGRTLGRAVETIESSEDRPLVAATLAQALARDSTVSHVVAVHCETTSGVLNPLAEIAQATAAAGRSLLIDAMSSFGAIALDSSALDFDALAASANKCLEGVPGLAFVIARRQTLSTRQGTAPSVSLDLYDQWQGFEHNGQWRFTPPTHVAAALDAALDQLDAEGGVAARYRRYADNCQRLIAGMTRLGFEPILAPNHQAPIIVTFRMPRTPGFDFARFYDALHARGYVIYPGKLTKIDSFRIGCIGAIGAGEIEGAVAAASEALNELGLERV